MIARINLATNGIDTRANVRQKKLHKAGFEKINKLWIEDIYTIAKAFTQKQLESIAESLTNPITGSFTIRLEKRSLKPKNKFTFAIEIGLLPGVTDNVAHTTKEIIEDGLNLKFAKGENVYTSQITFLEGKISKSDAEEIALTLHNPLIQKSYIKSYEEYIRDGGMDVIVPKVKLLKKPEISVVNLNVPDNELVKIGKSGIANRDDSRRGPLALDLTYMKTIKNYFKKFGRDPTDIELETLAQTWSEHCKHTIFANPLDDIKKGLYKTYIKGATEKIRKSKNADDFCVSVFTDNSGAIVFDNDYLITHKVETHNSPSALDPFGGAITGIVGVNRDTIGFGMGAKPIANIYGFCLSDPRIDIPLYRDKSKSQKMLSARRIMDGVIEGVNAGGNQSGIPTPQGFIYFDERYRGKPLVFAGTVGLIPKKIKGKPSHIKKAKPGDLIVMTGGRIGKDGIHGATFSSVALDEGSPAAAVQIGDPITQKKMSDAIINEARGELLYNSITDCGAGGISCSVTEMARESNGCEVNLEKAPLKYDGLDPWEIWISESQERMTFAIPPKNWKKFEDLMQKRGVEATVIGKFTDSGQCIVSYNGKKIMDIDLEFLHYGLPIENQKSAMPKTKIHKTKIKQSNNLSKTLIEMLSRLNISSYEFISRQYDHIVQGNAVLGPLHGSGRVNSEASVIRPLLSSKKGLVLSQALYPSYSELDPYNMAAASIDTAIRNAVAIGANPEYIALLDNFCWSDSDNPERLWQLKQSVKGCFDYAVSFGTPFISGKDSMFNDFKGYDKYGNPIKISVPPTLLISSIGVINDIEKTVSLDAKFEDDLIYILGATNNEMGGSEFELAQKSKGGSVPAVNAKLNLKLYKKYYNSVQKNLVASSISLGRGGLGVALAKKAIGGMKGMEINIKNIPYKLSYDNLTLFSESQGRLLVTVSPEKKKDFERIMTGITFSQIGKVTKSPVIKILGLNQKEIINIKLNKATEAYRKTFEDY